MARRNKVSPRITSCYFALLRITSHYSGPPASLACGLQHLVRARAARAGRRAPPEARRCVRQRPRTTPARGRHAAGAAGRGDSTASVACGERWRGSGARCCRWRALAQLWRAALARALARLRGARPLPYRGSGVSAVFPFGRCRSSDGGDGAPSGTGFVSIASVMSSFAALDGSGTISARGSLGARGSGARSGSEVSHYEVSHYFALLRITSHYFALLREKVYETAVNEPPSSVVCPCRGAVRLPAVTGRYG